MVPILLRTAGVEGAWEFRPVARPDGVAIVAIRFARPGGVDIVCHYGAVFIFDLLDGLVARGDVAAASDAARAAVRALELKHAARRDAAARESLSAQQGQAPVGRRRDAAARESFAEPQPGSSPVGGYAGAAVPRAALFPSGEAGHSASQAAPAGAGLPDLPPAGDPLARPPS